MAVCVLPMWAAAQQEALYQGSHDAMGTTYTIQVYARDAAAAQAELDDAFDEVDRLDDLLSNYKPASEISRINREAADHAVTTDPETFAFLQASLEWSRRSHGAFDITVGRLLRTWGFFDHKGAVPSEAQRRADAAGVGWQHVHLDAALRTVRFTGSSELEIDPGGIGKGYAVDKVVALLKQIGVQRALVSAGRSTVYAIGSPPNASGWTIEIPDPRQPGKTLQTLQLHDTSISTSACTEKYFVEAGHLYCHLFDPRTLAPVEGVLQTTVIAPLGVDSDALSAATFVNSAAEDEQMLEAMPDVRALVIRGSAGSVSMNAVRWPK